MNTADIHQEGYLLIRHSLAHMRLAKKYHAVLTTNVCAKHISNVCMLKSHHYHDNRDGFTVPHTVLRDLSESLVNSPRKVLFNIERKTSACINLSDELNQHSMKQRTPCREIVSVIQIFCRADSVVPISSQYRYFVIRVIWSLKMLLSRVRKKIVCKLFTRYSAKLASSSPNPTLKRQPYHGGSCDSGGLTVFSLMGSSPAIY